MKYITWLDYINLQVGLALYWWQRLITSGGSGRIRVNIYISNFCRHINECNISLNSFEVTPLFTTTLRISINYSLVTYTSRLTQTVTNCTKINPYPANTESDYPLSPV